MIVFRKNHDLEESGIYIRYSDLIEKSWMDWADALTSDPRARSYRKHQHNEQSMRSIEAQVVHMEVFSEFAGVCEEGGQLPVHMKFPSFS